MLCMNWEEELAFLLKGWYAEGGVEVEKTQKGESKKTE